MGLSSASLGPEEGLSDIGLHGHSSRGMPFGWERLKIINTNVSKDHGALSVVTSRAATRAICDSHPIPRTLHAEMHIGAKYHKSSARNLVWFGKTYETELLLSLLQKS